MLKDLLVDEGIQNIKNGFNSGSKRILRLSKGL